eukprot:12499935-Alexandrium_andersonii.AAC.1
MAGALVTPHELAKAGYIECHACRECGCAKADLAHMLWGCPVYALHRARVHTLMGGQGWEVLPRALALHGLSPSVNGLDAST